MSESKNENEGLPADGGGGAPAGDTHPAGDAGSGSLPLFDWGKVKESLPEDIRNDASLSTITSLEGLTKSYIHAQKAIGKDKIAIPDKHATEADYRQIFSKLGVPDKIDDYKLSLDGVEMDQTVLEKIKAVAHEKGMLPWQLESVVKTISGIAKEANDKYATESKAEHEKRVSSLKTEWGKAFDTQVERANAAMRHLLPNAEDQQALVDMGLGDHPAVLKMLANASKLMGEDKFIGQGDGKLTGVTPGDALAKARAIQADMSHPYRNPSHPNHRAAKKEVADLYALAFPE